MAFCIQCGNPLAADARFCARCGTRVEPMEPVTPVAAPEAPAAEPIAPAEPAFIPEEPAQTAEIPAVQEEVVSEELPAEPDVQQTPAEPVEEGPVYADVVEPEYVPPVKVERKPLIAKKPLSLGKKFLVVFLTILAFIFGTATVTALCLRETLTADNVVEFIETVDISQIQANIIVTDAEQDSTLADWLILQLEKKGVDCSVLTTNDVEDFLEACILPYVQDEAKEFASALLTGKGKAAVTMDEIRELVQISCHYLAVEHGIAVSGETEEALVAWIDGFGVTEMANTRYLQKQYGDVLDTGRMVLSWAAVAVFGFLTALMLLFIWLTNRSIIRNLNSTGIVAVLVGGMFAVFTVINLLLPALLMTICGNIDLIYNAVSMVITAGTTVILATLGAGVVLLLFSRLLQIKIRK